MAAGLGFKTFTTGEVLTAADTNGYLMQGINVFASTAARDAAITSPQEGQFAYTKDTNSLWYYTGSAWAASGATGDIEGVTAGVGISGGGTSGTVTVTNSMATEITAAGDIIVGTGSGTFDNLPIGTTAQVLTADTTVSPYKVKWATPSGGGKVLQVVQATTTTVAINSTTTFQTTNVAATITPSSATSKVLVMTAIGGVRKGGANTGDGVKFRLMRDATAIVSKVASYFLFTNTTLTFVGAHSYNYLDSPATTSAITYKMDFAQLTAVADVQCQYDNETSTMILMEIGA